MDERLILSVLILVSLSTILFDFSALFETYKRYSWILSFIYLLVFPIYFIIYDANFLINLVFVIIILLVTLYLLLIPSKLSYYFSVISISFGAFLFYLEYTEIAENLLSLSFMLITFTLLKDIGYDKIFKN